MKHTILTAAAIAALFGAPVAQADTASSSVKLSQLAIFAFDLLPDDGLSPSFEVLASPDIRTQAGSLSVAGLLSPLSYTENTATTHAQAAVGASGLSLNASIEGTGDQTLYLSASTGSTWMSVVRVAPGAGLILSGQLDMQVCGPQYLHCEGTVDFSMSLDGSNYEHRNLDTSSPMTQYHNPVGVAYTNYTDSYKDITLSIYAATRLSATTATHVPEPSGHALLMAGGLVAAGVAQRRKLRS